MADVDVGTTANDGTGDPLRTAFIKINASIGPIETKLAGVEEGATANSTDAALRARASHTGEQAISTITGLQDSIEGEFTSQLQVSAGRLPIAAGGNHPIVINESGRADLWQTPDGIDGRFARPGTFKVPVTAGRLPLALGSDSGEVMALKDSSVYFPGDLFKPDVYLATALGNQQVWARTVDPKTLETTVQQITFSQQGDFSAVAAVDSNLVRVVSAHDPIYTRGAVGFRPKLGAKAKLRILIVHGQSNAVGAQDGIVEVVPSEVITATAPLPGKMLMFNGGIMPHQGGHSSATRDTPLDPSMYASVVDAREGAGFLVRECLGAGAAEVLAGPWGAEDPVLVFNCGHGSSGFYDLVFDGLDVKQTPWENIEALLAAAETYATAQSRVPEIIGFIYNQGEGDQDRSAETWATMMQKLRDEIDILATSISQTTAVPLLLCQVGAPRYSTGLASAPTLGIELAAHDMDDTYCAPLYWAEVGDYATVHYPSDQHRLIGEYCGKILADIEHGVFRKHLYAVSAVRSEGVVTVTMSEKITIDSFGVLDPDEFGVSYADSTGVIAVSGVKAVGNQLQITLLATPSGTGEVVSIACDNATQYPAESNYFGLGRGYGQRSCIRAIMPRGWSQSSGRPFWEWAAHQRITVTV